jgi:hypothetical protein
VLKSRGIEATRKPEDGLDSSGSEYGSVDCSFEYGSETSGSIKCC